LSPYAALLAYMGSPILKLEGGMVVGKIQNNGKREIVSCLCFYFFMYLFIYELIYLYLIVSEFSSDYFDVQISPETITVSVAIYQR
jgi:hypothetical protein